MVSVAVIIGVALMIDSFRYTVIAWLGQTLQGDVYVSVPGFNATSASAAIDPRALEIIHGWPGVARVDTLRSVSVDSPPASSTWPLPKTRTWAGSACLPRCRAARPVCGLPCSLAAF